MKVDFFIVGAPKAGTTSLHYYLDSHPDITMSTKKEPNYFSAEEIFNQDLFYKEEVTLSLEEYEKLFSLDKKGNLYGESSVSYLFYKGVPKKIYQYNRFSKIIIMLRNPLERAYSHYLMDFRLGLVKEEFSEIFKKSSGVFFQQYFKLGNYTNQIKRYLDIFKKENIHIIWYDDFKNDALKEVHKVCSFLSVDTKFQFHMNREYNKFRFTKNKMLLRLYSIRWFRKSIKRIFSVNMASLIRNLLFRRTNKPKLDVSLNTKIREYYNSEILDLEKLLKKDLGHWKK